ncbi:hypothetical protein TWF481_002774 [Arthrobotrys musiformis]|uniref:Uncharacterized protein n=1 Tax=Arthrobotrys musiformis TaxID=47236 RepID=A0AAV9VU34_9PEZI
MGGLSHRFVGPTAPPRYVHPSVPASSDHHPIIPSSHHPPSSHLRYLPSPSSSPHQLLDRHYPLPPFVALTVFCFVLPPMPSSSFHLERHRSSATQSIPQSQSHISHSLPLDSVFFLQCPTPKHTSHVILTHYLSFARIVTLGQGKPG